MADQAEALVEIDGLSKNYGGLRPVRIQSLTVRRGDCLALMGLDQPAAEMFVTLITGAALPDEGTVRLFGRATSAITSTEDWLTLLDRVGILSDRAVLVEQYSVAQNIAMPFTLELEPIPSTLLPRVIDLMREVGLDEDVRETSIGAAAPHVRARARLARAVALDPTLVLAEHPSAALPRDAVSAFATDLARVAERRQLGLVAVSADKDFVRALDGTTLIVEGASGEVRKQRFWEKLR